MTRECGFGLVATGNVSVKFRSGVRRAVVTLLGPPRASFCVFESRDVSKDSCTKAAFLRLPDYKGISYVLTSTNLLPYLEECKIQDPPSRYTYPIPEIPQNFRTFVKLLVRTPNFGDPFGPLIT